MKFKSAIFFLSMLTVSFILIVDKGYTPQNIDFQHMPKLLDGPDKAFAQNMHMIRDRKSNSMPYERLRTQKLSQENARLASTERNFNWQQITTNIPGRSRAMLYHNPSQTLFLGAVTGGLWKNTNYKADAKWSQVTGFQESAVNCIAQDPNVANTLYIGTGESFTAFVNYRESTGLGSGIYYSENGGTTWEIMDNTSNFYYINDLSIRNERGISVIYAAVGSGEYRTRTFVQEGLYRSVDKGKTWDQVLPNIDNSETIYQVSDLEMDKNGKMYASTMRNSQNLGGGLILSSENGLDWSIHYSGFSDWLATVHSFDIPGRSIVKVAPSNPEHLYFVSSSGYVNALEQLRDYTTFLWQSLDGGVTWSKISLPVGAYTLPWHAMTLAIDPNDEHKVLIGGLDVFVLNDASNPPVSEPDVFDPSVSNWIRLTYWAAPNPSLSQSMLQRFSPEDKQFFRGKYVHADIHDIQFMNHSSDEVLITTDGGVFHTSNMSVTSNLKIGSENPIQNEFPVFKQALKSLNTTQYYYASIHPDKGKMEALGGAQDNGTNLRNWVDNEEVIISYGDGAYNFFDKDDKNLKITMSHNNLAYIHVDDKVEVNGLDAGLFINPTVYDDQSNFLYSNTSTSTYGGLRASLKGRYYDTIQVLNVNKYLQKPDLGLDTISFLKLNTGIKEAITAMQLSRTSLKLNKTIVIGTENGKVFKVTGLPYSATSARVDNNQLPIGYISSVDVGFSENNLLVTISNFGLASVWSTSDGGKNWINLERNLPDMPVRWGRLNPYNDNKVIIATEMGIWGLENIEDVNEEWQSYNNGLPAIRVDMFDLRPSDSKILAATHGQGLYIGTYDQGGDVPLSLNSIDNPKMEVVFYPNPVSDVLFLRSEAGITKIEIFDMQGKWINSLPLNGANSIDVQNMNKGLYIFKGYDALGKLISYQKILVN